MGKYKMRGKGLKKKQPKKEFVAKKAVRIGFSCIRNEEQAIAGWAKMMDYFCEEVYVILDPDTSDKTLDILLTLPYDIKISYQDKSLGDSDDGGLGPKHELTMHIEQNNFVKKNIKIGEWFLSIDCDERYHPHDWYRIMNELKFAELHDFDTLMSRRLIEPCDIDLGQLKYIHGQFYYDPDTEKNGKRAESMFAVKWPDMARPVRFQKRTQHWYHGIQPHGGYKGRLYNMASAFPLWHFHKLKYQEILPTSERDELSSTYKLMDVNDGMIPLIPITHQMSDWRDLYMLEVGKYGDIKYPSILSTIKADGVNYSKSLSRRMHEDNNRRINEKRKWVNNNKELLEKHSNAYRQKQKSKL